MGMLKTIQSRHTKGTNMNIKTNTTNKLNLLMVMLPLTLIMQSCGHNKKAGVKKNVPEYFLLRPDVEKAYGYSHAVKIGNSIKVSGAVSMDDQGNPTAIGDLKQQMINLFLYYTILSFLNNK